MCPEWLPQVQWEPAPKVKRRGVIERAQNLNLKAGDLRKQQIPVRCSEEVGGKRRVVRGVICEEKILHIHRTAANSGLFLF